MQKRTAFIENGIYHVYNRGNGYEPIFRNFGNYDYFLKKYHEYLTPYWETMAWCLMPNHYHFLVRIKPQPGNEYDTSDLCIKAYADFCGGYVLAYNKQHHRQGSLFMRSFKRKPIYDNTYLRKVICYIHNNPVKDGFVQRAEDWHHSSFLELYKTAEPEARNNEIIKLFGNKQNFLHAHIAELSPGSIDLKASKIAGERMLGDSVYQIMKPNRGSVIQNVHEYRDAG